MTDEQIKNELERPTPSYLLLKTFVGHAALLVLFLSVLYWATR